MPLPDVCVVYLLRDRADGGLDVLLGYKRTGLGLGKVVGIGGKVEAGETIRHGAVREIHEETGLEVDPADLRPAGSLDYLFPSRPDWSQRSHVFTCRRWHGEPVETEEIVPAWFAAEDIPYARMWDDAARWLPGVLAGGSVDHVYTFGDDLATVVDEAPRLTL
ncbi:8-oxo-dGTP diphosphatase [Microbacterium sp. NPDC091313]